MKKIYFTMIFLAFVFTGFSQTEKGSWLLGGNIAFSSISSKENGNSSTATLFALNPKVGLFVVNNFAVIFNANYQSASSGGFSDHNLTIGPAVRYYFPGSELVKLFVGAGMGFGSTSDSHNTSYQFEAGPAFFITPGVAVEATVNYESASFKSDQSDVKMTQSTFGVGIGFMVYLGNKKK